MINKQYERVTIELKQNFNLKEIQQLFSSKGETQINLIIKVEEKIASYLLKNNRKFNLNHLKALKAKDYVEKISF